MSKILVACEFSGVVRDALRARGHDAWSCDLLPCEADPQWHIQGDALVAMRSQHWDMMIAHPPCTHLAVSGARWFKDKQPEQKAALAFASALWGAGIFRIALENPVSILSSQPNFGKPSQIIQPWQFGHRETKATCLWLKNLPHLVPTDVVGPPATSDEKREFAKVHRMAPGPDRARNRSRTYSGVAAAIAEQWGNVCQRP